MNIKKAKTVGEATTYTPTFLGLLMFIALAAGLVWVVFGIIRKLIKKILPVPKYQKIIYILLILPYQV